MPSQPAPEDSCRGSLSFGEEGALSECRIEDAAHASSRDHVPTPKPWPQRVVLTPAHPTHCPLQLGVTAGGAPGPIHVHIGAASRLLRLPILPAHIIQRLL